MGTMLTAYCESCGFVQHGINFGAGFSQHIPKIPALRKGSDVIVIEEFKVDADLRFYHQTEMYKGTFKKWGDADPELDTGVIQNYGIQSFDIWLSSNQNLCPRCGKYTMEFVQVGNWD